MTVLEQLKVEFVGTFFLTYFGGLCVLQATVKGISEEAMSVGLLVTMILITYFGRNISGAQYNPVISLSLAISGRQTYSTSGLYIGVQVFSSVFACSLLVGSVPNEILSAVAEHTMIGLPLDGKSSLLLKFFLEFIGTFFLTMGYYVIIANPKANPNLSAPGYSALFSAICLLLHKQSGAMLNLARLVGYCVISGKFTFSWLFLLADTIGGIAGGFLGNVLIKEAPKPIIQESDLSDKDE